MYTVFDFEQFARMPALRWLSKSLPPFRLVFEKEKLRSVGFDLEQFTLVTGSTSICSCTGRPCRTLSDVYSWRRYTSAKTHYYPCSLAFSLRSFWTVQTVHWLRQWPYFECVSRSISFSPLARFEVFVLWTVVQKVPEFPLFGAK